MKKYVLHSNRCTVITRFWAYIEGSYPWNKVDQQKKNLSDKISQLSKIVREKGKNF